MYHVCIRYLIELLHLYLVMIFLVSLLVIDWLYFGFTLYKEGWMLDCCFILLNSLLCMCLIFDRASSFVFGDDFLNLVVHD